MRRPIRHTLVLAVLLAGGTLAGCTAQAAAGTTISGESSSSASAITVSPLHGTPSPSATHNVTFDLLVNTDEKTVLGLNCDSLAALTGVASVPDEEDTVAAVLTDPATWKGHEATAPYADVIANAAMIETQPIRAALTNMSADQSAILTLIITHTPSVTEAHLGVGSTP